MQRKIKSPKTLLPLANKTLLPSHSMKAQISSWRASREGQAGAQLRIKHHLLEIHMSGSGADLAGELAKLSNCLAETEMPVSKL